MAHSDLQTPTKGILLQLMRFLYNSGIYLLGIAIRILSLFNEKAKHRVNGAKTTISSLPDLKKKKVIWFHCASLGEFDQGLPLMNILKKEHPDHFLAVTFFSASGYRHYHKRDHQIDWAGYLPIDTPKNAQAFIAKLNPTITCFVKYEFWLNHLEQAKRSGSTLFAISAIFRDNHRFFKWYGEIFRKLLFLFDFIFVQDNDSVKRLQSINIQHTAAYGDARFDRVLENKVSTRPNPIIQTFKGQESLFILGSSWPEDETFLSEMIHSFNGKILIAPHDVSEKHIQQILDRFNVPSVRYTNIEQDLPLSDYKLLVLDTIGHLSSAYTHGDIAYVGGGFTGKLHNILEPAVFGLPIIIGPKHKRFPEAQQFIDQGFVFSVSNQSELESAFHHIQENITQIKEQEQLFVTQQSGSSQKIYDYLISNSIV